MTDDRNVKFKKNEKYKTNLNGVNINFFTGYSSKYRIIRIVGRLLTWKEQKNYIKKLIKKDNNLRIIIYHSPEFYKLYKLLYKNNVNYILEVEEVYSDVINNKLKKSKEIKYIQLADKYIFPTELLNKEINKKNKPYVLIHGTYNNERKLEKLKLDKNMIHCVYAGTFDPRKGGVFAAIDSARFLSKDYCIHILGFGSEEQINRTKERISEINNKKGAKVIYEGLKTGEDYIRFIQSCDIGLSTQNPDAAFNATSFPSKILSYMSNGLRVVSIRIPAIETSDIGKYMYYYDKQTPKDIANAIMSVDLKDNYDSRKIIKELDKKFQKDLKELLDE